MFIAAPKAMTALSGAESRLWQKMSNEIKGSKNLSIFEKNIESLKGQDCNCRSYKNVKRTCRKWAFRKTKLGGANFSIFIYTVELA